MRWVFTPYNTVSPTLTPSNLAIIEDHDASVCRKGGLLFFHYSVCAGKRSDTGRCPQNVDKVDDKTWT